MCSHHHPAAASYCYYCPSYSQCHHHPPPPPPPDCHPIYHPPPQPQPHPYSPQTHIPNSRQTHPRSQERYLEQETETQQTITSLLRRISTLESALRGRTSSSSSYSLRSAAARTIQTHFRSFLSRRSRTLRQLKDLASIKSALSYLKLSVSKQTHFDYDAVYRQARGLVHKLDSIKGCDPMIRDGKCSVRRELNKFLDFISGFCTDWRYERKMGNTKVGGLKNANMEKLRGLVERIDKLAEELNEEEESEVNESSGNKKGGVVKQLRGDEAKVKKSVSFADNDGNVYRVLRRDSEPIVEDDDDVCREVEEIGSGSKDDDEVEARSENDSDDEMKGFEL